MVMIALQIIQPIQSMTLTVTMLVTLHKYGLGFSGWIYL